MANLPLANIFNRKTRTTVGILAVALGVALVLVLVGLAHGSLDETADRIKNVGADIIFQAPHSSPFLALNSGVVDVRYGARLLDVPGIVAAAPVLTGQLMKLKGKCSCRRSTTAPAPPLPALTTSLRGFSAATST
jgi:ABC-type lipoprotein release transport system permease subunit